MMYKHFHRVAKRKEGALKSAAVIRYDKENDKAPIVVARGQGEIAEKIIAKAKEHNIPLQEDAILLENLLNLDLGNNIPPQLYQVVAEVLLFVRRANVGSKVVSHPPLLQHTSYWEEEGDSDQEHDISIDDLLQTIRDI
jgi:flagellar biosynthesis protein